MNTKHKGKIIYNRLYPPGTTKAEKEEIRKKRTEQKVTEMCQNSNNNIAVSIKADPVMMEITTPEPEVIQSVEVVDQCIENKHIESDTSSIFETQIEPVKVEKGSPLVQPKSRNSDFDPCGYIALLKEDSNGTAEKVSFEVSVRVAYGGSSVKNYSPDWPMLANYRNIRTLSW